MPNSRPDPVANDSVRVSVFGKTDLGRTRDHNEDTFLVADLSTGNASLHPQVQEHAIGPRGSLFMVADGMGGAAAGELASAMAAELIYSHLRATWSTDPNPTAEQFAFRMRESVEVANSRIHDYAREHPDVRGMGTTVTVAGVFGNELYLAQIGDSRAYLVRRGVATQLTKDQSLMQRLVDAGELTEEEAERSERRNIILQALGPDPRVKVDLTWQEIRRGDLLILCSDGLSGSVKREELAELAARFPDLEALCTELVNLANQRGGPDNITAVAARFDGPGLPPPEQTEQPAYQVFTLPGQEDGEDDLMDTNGIVTTEIPAHRPAPAPRQESKVRPGFMFLALLVGTILLYLVLAS
jgi:protein phosphatase